MGVGDSVHARARIGELMPERGLVSTAPVRRVPQERPRRSACSEVGVVRVRRVRLRVAKIFAESPHVRRPKAVERVEYSLRRLGRGEVQLYIPRKPARPIERQFFRHVSETFVEEGILEGGRAREIEVSRSV